MGGQREGDGSVVFWGFILAGRLVGRESGHLCGRGGRDHPTGSKEIRSRELSWWVARINGRGSFFFFLFFFFSFLEMLVWCRSD